jgi:hypothetical protein
MDQYYINENFYLFVNDEFNKSENNIKKCDFNISFDKPIILNKQMECALVKLCNPTNLYSYMGNKKVKLTLNVCFQDTDATDQAGGLIYDSDFRKEIERMLVPDYSKEFYLDINTDEEEKIINSLNNIAEEMNLYIKRLWNRAFPKTSIKISDNEPKVSLDLSTQGSPKLHPPNFLEYKPLEIINTNKEITLEPARVIINTIQTSGHKEIALVGYIIVNKSFHNILGIDESKFPLNEYFAAGYDPNPNPLNVLRMFVITKGKLPLNINKNLIKIVPDIIYIYCDIVSESYVRNQKENILQLYVLENSTKKDIETISFENLIYIPLRVDEINSITIQMKNKDGQILYYDRGNINAVLKIRPS